MQINTPAHLIAYLEALCLAHPLVQQVITGEGSRGEAATLATAKYPHVRIETPDVTIPRSESQKTLSTRIYVLGKSSVKGDKEDDRIKDEAYRIAEGIVLAMDEHMSEGAVDIALVDGIEINPCVAMGSDQLLGWMFEVAVNVNKALCKNSQIDHGKFFIPGFTWTNVYFPDGPTGYRLSFADVSINMAGATSTWYWKEEAAFPDPQVFTYTEGLEIYTIQDGPAVRIVHVWLKMELEMEAGSRELWAYACIDLRYSTGSSVPFIPYYPY